MALTSKEKSEEKCTTLAIETDVPEKHPTSFIAFELKTPQSVFSEKVGSNITAKRAGPHAASTRRMGLGNLNLKFNIQHRSNRPQIGLQYSKATSNEC